MSDQLNDTQQRWPIIEKEAYAIVYSIQKFRPYLLGSKFTVNTDHKPLQHLFTSEMRNARIQRWAILLDEYGCDVQYVSGSKNVAADALSRLGLRDDVEVGNHMMMTRELSPNGPANYASRIEEGANVQSCVHIDEPRSVNVIDSDRAPAVQLQSNVDPCAEQENQSKEKFQEFLENHSDFQTIQSEDAEVQRIVKILGDPTHSNHVDISRYYVLEDGLLYRVSEPSKCGEILWDSS